MGKFDALLADINIEKRHNTDLCKELNQLQNELKGKPSFSELRAVGSILHDFYTGIEKIFERIALVVDGDLPKGEDWHIQLLRRMTVSVPDRRPPVLTVDLGEVLSEYLSFRHLFRNIYGFELKWERCQELAMKLRAVSEKFIFQLEEFEKFLSEIGS